MGTALRRSGVLVIDDDMMVRDALRACLVAAEQDVFLAANGMEALNIAARAMPALVICDIKMPGINGLVICERLRQLPGYGSVPIAMLTFHDDERTRTAAIAVGATAFLGKPFRPMNVLDLVVRYLPVRPAAIAKIRRDNDRASSIANLAARSPAIKNATARLDAPGASHPGHRVLNILRG